MLAHLIGFVAVAALVIVTPGPDTALTIRNTLAGGQRAGTLTGVGVALGQLVWTAGTSLGVLGALLASERAFTLLKLVGAGYLAYLGLHSIRAAFRPGTPAGSVAVAPVPASRAVRQGLVNDLANPKMAAFFASLLPQFVSGDARAGIQMLALGSVFSLMTFAWLACYAFALGRFRDVLRRGRVRRVLDAVAGGVLVAFGIRLATAP
ncbi:LysE family translocator [Amycolatopsis sp. SID8362]|uniref:LysE family translocator n=1 Tax=Amycolatopsis sp. SID8362 TaxID=2690346 RepID=UPI001EF209E4|nr:LysE family translocator [Amycolatopsis sp. SID8362]